MYSNVIYKPQHAHLSDLELLTCHVNGVPGAFADLVNRHHRQFWWVLKATRVPEEHRMDVLQEGMLRIHRFARNFNGEGQASVATWMTRIMRNSALTYLKRHRREAQPGLHYLYESEVEEQQRVTTGVHMREDVTVTRLDIHRYLKVLTPPLRAVITLSAHGMSEGEIADELQIPLGTVKSRKARAKQRLGDMLSGAEEYAYAAAG
ncbi:MAG TPA: sigma-70 family RNA polymerase sigma factor [Candidatus Corynebacterium gallistercoris]|uniref:Sigma-70 family RNA polymerase sigma factor n=1 Tax=Candidatus Corynebacterium gallistercoris TaxID=2838530 RepID=A0A9D1UQF7_9CORY|nr:sigma-70 family RNA polymerase sigma factor [Candidatus Corynebacterium gallistercoris]